jgi:hypothetical protein
VSDLAQLRETAIPRTDLAKAIVRRHHPIWQFLVMGVLMFGAVLFITAVVAGIVAFAYAIARDGLFNDTHDDEVGAIALGILGLGVLLFAVRIMPRYVRDHTAPTRAVIAEGDLFDVTLVDARQRFALRPEHRVEYKLYLERDGARFHVFAPVPATTVLHRLNTHVAFAFDRAGTAHKCRVTPIWY